MSSAFRCYRNGHPGNVFHTDKRGHRKTVNEFECRPCQQALSCEFSASEDDYICDQVIEKCHLSCLCKKFLEKKGVVTLVDHQLRQYSADHMNNQKNDQVNNRMND